MTARILCVEDDSSILDLQMALLRRLGYQPLAATSGEEGYRLAVDEQPDAIVLDVMLPGSDGFTVAKRLRENRDTRSIPLAFVSAKGEPEHFRKGFSCGGQIYLAKPFTTRALQVAVESLLRNKARPAPARSQPSPPKKRRWF